MQGASEQGENGQGKRYVQLTVTEALHALQAKRCPACAEAKSSGQPFCRSCYLVLPLYLRGWVLRGTDDSYFAENYRRALQHILDLSSLKRFRVLSNGMRWSCASAEDLEAAGYRLIEHARCEARRCCQHISWYWTPQNRRMAVNLADYRPHFETCRDPEYFTRMRELRKVRTSAKRKGKTA